MTANRITVTYYNSEGDEVSDELPARHEVCQRCEGHGTHLTPSIGNHAYSSEEFEQEFSEDEDREAYFERGGKYDVTCEVCDGKNVVLVVDEEACQTAEQKEILQTYTRSQRESEQEAAADRRTRWFEDGCPMD